MADLSLNFFSRKELNLIKLVFKFFQEKTDFKLSEIDENFDETFKSILEKLEHSLSCYNIQTLILATWFTNKTISESQFNQALFDLIQLKVYGDFSQFPKDFESFFLSLDECLESFSLQEELNDD